MFNFCLEKKCCEGSCVLKAHTVVILVLAGVLPFHKKKNVSLDCVLLGSVIGLSQIHLLVHLAGAFVKNLFQLFNH